MKILPVKGYEELYEVSDTGRIFSYYNMGNHKPDKTRRELNPSFDARGYLTINLTKNGKTKQYKVHRLVAEAFIPNPKNKPEVNHLDGDHQNNDQGNLEWATRVEQEEHALRMALKDTRGEKNGMAKLTNEQIVEIRTSKLGLPYLSGKYSVSKSLISMIKNNKRWKHIK